MTRSLQKKAPDNVLFRSKTLIMQTISDLLVAEFILKNFFKINWIEEAQTVSHHIISSFYCRN